MFEQTRATDDELLALIAQYPQYVNGGKYLALGDPADAFPPLMFVAFSDRPRVVQALLDAGADPRLATYRDGRSALDSVAIHGRVDLVRQMLEKGADPRVGPLGGNVVADVVRTCFFHDVLCRNEADLLARLEIIKLLVAHGAHPSGHQPSAKKGPAPGCSPLIMAFAARQAPLLIPHHWRTQMISLLLSLGADNSRANGCGNGFGYSTAVAKAAGNMRISGYHLASAFAAAMGDPVVSDADLVKLLALPGLEPKWHNESKVFLQSAGRSNATFDVIFRRFWPQPTPLTMNLALEQCRADLVEYQLKAGFPVNYEYPAMKRDPRRAGLYPLDRARLECAQQPEVAQVIGRAGGTLASPARVAVLRDEAARLDREYEAQLDAEYREQQARWQAEQQAQREVEAENARNEARARAEFERKREEDNRYSIDFGAAILGGIKKGLDYQPGGVPTGGYAVPKYVPVTPAPTTSGSTGSAGRGGASPGAGSQPPGKVTCAQAEEICPRKCHLLEARCGTVPRTGGIVPSLPPEPVKEEVHTHSIPAKATSGVSYATRSAALSVATLGAKNQATEECRTSASSEGGWGHNYSDWKHVFEPRCPEVSPGQWNCEVEGHLVCTHKRRNPAHAEWLKKRDEVERLSREYDRITRADAECRLRANKESDACREACLRESCR